MPRPRFQFRLSTLLWMTLAVACFFAGIVVERKAAEDAILERERKASKKEKEAAQMVELIFKRFGDPDSEDYEPTLKALHDSATAPDK
jgi:hypothetical protein